MPEEQPVAVGISCPPPLLYGGALTLGLLLRRALPGIFLPRAVRRTVGWLGLAVGLPLIGWAIGTMRRAHTPVDPAKPVTALLTEGPFRFSRNPGYLAMTAVYSGIALLANALSALLLLPAVFAVMQGVVIKREERYLERRFGRTYTDYKARVRRWI